MMMMMIMLITEGCTREIHLTFPLLCMQAAESEFLLMALFHRNSRSALLFSLAHVLFSFQSYGYNGRGNVELVTLKRFPSVHILLFCQFSP